MARLAPLDLNNLTPEQRPSPMQSSAARAAACAAPSKPGCAAPAWPTPPRRRRILPLQLQPPADLSEFAILLTGKHWKAQFEFWAHARLAREAGLDPAIIEAVRSGEPPPFGRDTERVLHDFVTTTSTHTAFPIQPTSAPSKPSANGVLSTSSVSSATTASFR